MAAFAGLALRWRWPASLAGCFQPLYGDAVAGRRRRRRASKLSAVEVAPIDAPNGTPARPRRRRGAQRADLRPHRRRRRRRADPPAQHQAHVHADQQVIVDITTARPDVQNYGINATYTLTEIATGKTVVTGTTFARVSYDIPGQQQRFAGARGLRDAENRAAKVIADNITLAAGVVFRRGDVIRVRASLAPHAERIDGQERLIMIALKASDVDRFIARPDPARPIVLVFGPDAGLVRERVEALMRASVDDPERSVRAGAPRGRRARRRAVAAGRGGAHRAAVRRPPRGLVKAGSRNIAAAVETGARRAVDRLPRRHRGRRSAQATRRCARCARRPRTPPRCPAMPTASAISRG